MKQMNWAAAVLLAGVTVIGACSSASAAARHVDHHKVVSSETTAGSGAAQGQASVPQMYLATYDELSSNLSDLEAQGSAGVVDPVGVPGGPVMAGAINLADDNRGTSLLEPEVLPEIADELDTFADLGMEGVTLQVGYPMLLPSFPNSGAYLSFYEHVSQMVAAHQMTLLVELQPVFPEPQISSLHPDYSGLTLATYEAQQRQEAQIVIDDLHPHYLTVLDEPSTFAANLGLHFANPLGVVGLLDAELDGLDRGSTLVGAGIGTWESPAIEQAIATKTSVDYLAVHLYPTGEAQIKVLNEVTAIAASARKPLVMDETWLSKADPSGRPGPGGAAKETVEEKWSFWEPLDERFLSEVTTYARAHGLSFVAPFSTDLFFGYVNWTQSLQDAPDSTVRSQAAVVEEPNIIARQVDPVGEAYASAIRR